MPSKALDYNEAVFLAWPAACDSFHFSSFLKKNPVKSCKFQSKNYTRGDFDACFLAEISNFSLDNNCVRL